MEINEYPLSEMEQAMMTFDEANALPLTRNVLPRELVVGDKIVTGTKKSAGKRTYTTERVERVEHWACSQRGTHVNGSGCYSWHLPVKVLA